MKTANFIFGFTVGLIAAIGMGVMIFMFPGLQAPDTTTGQLQTSPQTPENSPLQAIFNQAASQSAQGPQCPRPDEFTRVVNDFKHELDTARNPHRLSAISLRRIYRAFNPDSIINYSGYELYDLIGKIYTDCTGLAAPEIVQLEEGYSRHICWDMSQDGSIVERIVIGPKDSSIMKLCEKPNE